MSAETTRDRLLDALVELAAERGYDAVEVAEIAAHAGLAEADFQAHFATKQDCAVAALEQMGNDHLRKVRAAYEAQPCWPDSLRAAAYAHADWIAENPKKARFGLFDALWAGELASAIRDRFFRENSAMIDAGRAVAPDPDSIPASTAESVVGAITGVMARGFSRTGDPDPHSFVPEMMYLAVRPYLGEQVARRELTMPRPTS